MLKLRCITLSDECEGSGEVMTKMHTLNYRAVMIAPDCAGPGPTHQVIPNVLKLSCEYDTVL